MDILIYVISAILAILIIAWIYQIAKYTKRLYLLHKETALKNGIDPDLILKIEDRDAYDRKIKFEIKD